MPPARRPIASIFCDCRSSSSSSRRSVTSCTVPTMRIARPFASRRMWACSCTQRMVPSGRTTRCSMSIGWPSSVAARRASLTASRSSACTHAKNASDDPSNWPTGTPKIRCASGDHPTRPEPSISATQLPMWATSCACSRSARCCSSASAVRTREPMSRKLATRPTIRESDQVRRDVALEDPAVLEPEHVEHFEGRVGPQFARLRQHGLGVLDLGAELRQDDVEPATLELVGGEAEHRQVLSVEEDDAAVHIDDQDGVVRRVERRLQQARVSLRVSNEQSRHARGQYDIIVYNAVDGYRRCSLARAAPRSVGGHLRNAAHVDTDHRQGTPCARAAGQSLVARDVRGDAARSHHARHAVCGRLLRNPLRLHRPSASDRDERRRRRDRWRWRRSRWPNSMRAWSRCCASSASPFASGRCRWRFRHRSGSIATTTTSPTMPDGSRSGGGCSSQTDEVLREFRSEFIGKCSPVHFFWGSFDLAVTRFSGRRGAGTGRRRSHDARSVLARGDQRRLLAGQRRRVGCGVLRLRRARAAGVQDARRPHRRRRSTAAIWASSS